MIQSTQDRKVRRIENCSHSVACQSFLVIKLREKEGVPNICKHGRENMVGNEAPSVLSKILQSE